MGPTAEGPTIYYPRLLLLNFGHLLRSHYTYTYVCIEIGTICLKFFVKHKILQKYYLLFIEFVTFQYLNTYVRKNAKLSENGPPGTGNWLFGFGSPLNSSAFLKHTHTHWSRTFQNSRRVCPLLAPAIPRVDTLYVNTTIHEHPNTQTFVFMFFCSCTFQRTLSYATACLSG